MAFNRDKFQYVDHTIKATDSREIIAIGQYCGQTIKGHARCNPEDTFDIEIGEGLAARRCNLKIAEKRLDNKQKQLDELIKEAKIISDKIIKAGEAVEFAEAEYDEAVKLLADFVENI